VSYSHPFTPLYWTTSEVLMLHKGLVIGKQRQRRQRRRWVQGAAGAEVAEVTGKYNGITT